MLTTTTLQGHTHTVVTLLCVQHKVNQGMIEIKGKRREAACELLTFLTALVPGRLSLVCAGMFGMGTEEGISYYLLPIAIKCPIS